MIEPFRIEVEESVLEDLRERLARTRFPDQIEGTGWEYGTPVPYLRELVRYWLDEYDWRAEEARLNQLDHFTTEPAPLTTTPCPSWCSTGGRGRSWSSRT